MHNSFKKKSRPIVVLFAVAAIAGFFMINLVNPNSFATADASVRFAHVTDRYAGQQPQAVDIGADYQPVSVEREQYSATVSPKPAPTPTPAPSATKAAAKPVAAAPQAPAASPGTAQAWAQQYLASMGMGDDQYSCLAALWNRESGWNVHASNASGAYGIPQALPGSKMASAGPDWQNSYQTQITWGMGYVDGRYGNPCGAWAHSQSTGWY
ncbi:lytic transglycosylase domain-containing protein [Gryllotalpicola protaetiae]|uniref:aggregation-promoting factor C-terminal-like domain-containing protein n=1 Tax=Gryllotalpicola protaetiae TaxID=2419771 RepID=UPI001C6563E0|nr:lytic transglycosylase domain-containing protein [Gryllotalpicola protaetiae]